MTPMQLDDAKALLEQSARLFAAGEMDSEELGKAAWNWAEARRKALAALGGTKASTALSRHVVPFGRNKGTPLHEADKKDLLYLSKVLPESILDESKARWRAANEELLAAVEAELATR